MAARMPRTVRLAGRRVKIKLDDSPMNTNVMGLHTQDQAVIHLDSRMPDDQLKSIAVHELVHDLEELVAVGMTEQDVTAFSSVLFAMIRDNPALMNWLQEK
jgi:hypothetical protein